jgi:hypothetical protein
MAAKVMRSHLQLVHSSGSSIPEARKTAAATVSEEEETPAWALHVKRRFDEVCALEEGWDGYNGRPVKWQTADFTFRMLQSICASDAPVPQIVPGSSGSLQVEWHLPHQTIELLVRAPYEVEAWREGPSIDEEEADLSGDFRRVIDWLEDQEPHAPVAAAN